ncbi:MAG: NAD-dependent epimerase/dehydratase family protein, partial [Myxococcota bacterium]
MKVLVTGVAGLLGRAVARRLLASGHEVLGIDRRPWDDPPEGIRITQADIRKRSAEEVFRTERPEAVIHMATVTHILNRSADRFRINLQGTRAVVEHSERYGVKRLVFAGRHTYYGAQADSPLYHTEDEPPLGLHAFPELADLVAADLFAGSALWRHPNLDTAVLRVVYTLGPARHGTLAGFLRGPRVPTVLGFDPLFHVLHEEDAAGALVRAAEAGVRGVF